MSSVRLVRFRDDVVEVHRDEFDVWSPLGRVDDVLALLCGGTPRRLHHRY
jgi:hypothetical protein